MSLLLDMHTLLWFLHDDARLGARARARILGSASLALSDASRWEIAIKVSTGLLPAMPDLSRVIGELGVQRIGIEDRHLARVETLPFHHRDPFDRLLVAQSLADNLDILTGDVEFAAYGVQVIDARI